MYEQIFDAYRRATESFLEVHQDLIRRGAQQWMSAPQAAGAATDWGQGHQKRFLDLTVEILNRHREAIDTIYRSLIHLCEQAARMMDAKSAEDYRHVLENIWRDWFESIKSQSETQFRDAQSWAGRSLEIVKSAQA